MTAIAEIIEFWFAPGMSKTWFVRDADFDRAVAAKFRAAYEDAVVGRLDHWRDDPEGCVALCLLLDQVPRNIFRDDPRAYATDAKAREVTRHALARGDDRRLPQARRLILYMPLEHSESLEDQELCVSLTGALDENLDWQKYAIQHRDIIARFGRFPHRNAVLGRASTAEEAEFLSRPGSSF